MGLGKLIAFQLKLNFNLPALAWYWKKKDKRFFGAIGLAALVVVSLLPLFFLYWRLVQLSYVQFVSLGQPGAVLTSAMTLSAALVAFFGIFYVMSAFYFSRDLPLLIPLPLRPSQIVGAKFFTVLVNNYLTIAPFLLPALIFYGTRRAEGVLYWLCAAIVFILFPVIPLALVSALVLAFMRITNLGGRRDTLRLIGMLIAVAFGVGFNAVITSIPQGQEMEFIARLLSEEMGLVSYIGKIYPPAVWATKALTAGGSAAVQNLSGLLLASLAGVYLMLFLGERLFYRGLIGGEEVRSGKRISADALEKKLSRDSSPAMAIAMREIKILIRTPIYMFNSIFVVLLVPVLFVIPAVTGGNLNAILNMAKSSADPFVLVVAGAGFIGAMSIFAPAASSSFSREGRQFWISKVIPVDPLTQINGKILYSYLLTFLSVPLLALFYLLVARISFAQFVLAVLLGAAISLPSITVSLLIDLMRPYLDWDNPQKAIKQNVNVVLSMVASGGLLYLVYLACRKIYDITSGVLPVYLGMFALSLVLGLIPYLVMARIAAKRFSQIET